MSSRLEDTSAILGEYMIKGWTLTDLHCADCGVTPLMREPPALAARAGRTPIQFCAQCDGRPDAAPAAAPSASTSSSLYATPALTAVDTEPTAHAPAPAPALPSPSRPTATTRGDPDAAADAIGDLLLKGYSLLQDTCPQPSCRGVPLVGYPRRRDGTKDSRRECVSCGGRWVDEKDLQASGLKETKESVPALVPAPAPAAPKPAPTAFDSPFGIIQPAPDAPSLPLAPFSDEPESPRSKMRRELYGFGTAINTEVKRKREEEEEKKNKGKEKAMASESDSATAGFSVPTSAPAGSSSASAVKAAPVALPTPASTSSGREVFVAADHRPEIPDGKLRVVVVSTGSVASVKIPNIVSELCADGNVEVQVVSTDASLHFFDRDAVEADNPGVRVWTDSDEWSDWKAIGDPILHIELRRWADLVVIAPVSADMLAKIAGGLCDNLPLSLLRALSPETPVILCPAMNTHMYAHPLTARHLAFVRSVLKYYILGPQGAGRLACGDVGAGKMTEWKDIVQAVLGYAAVFRNRPDGDSSMLEALLSGSVPTLPSQNQSILEVDAGIPPVVVAPQLQGSVLPRLVPTFSIHPPTEREVIHVKHTPRPRQRRPTFTSVAAKIPATLLSYLLFPLLAILHAMFTVSSIVLRVAQSRPEPLPELTKPAPSHLGLILVPGNGPRKVVKERYIESVRRAVVWAGEWGVDAVSVWDGQGLGVQHHDAVTSSLLDLPLSPPSSGHSSPPDSDSDGLIGTLGDETVTKTVYVNSPSGPRRVQVHFLAPAASDAITRITQQYIRDGILPADIKESALGAAIFADLGIPSDPDLMVIHHLSPPGFWRGLLPRPAPELWGYPAWALRITEIYTHPPTLPFYLPFIGKLLHNSPLPILRKLGASFPDEIDVGVLDTDAWDGAQSAWEKVEQRRGK